MKKEFWLVIATAGVTAFLLWQFGPRRVIEKIVPNIVTVHDTVSVDKLPAWFTDSVKKWKKRVHTTDTLRLYVTETIVRDTGSTHFIYVGQDTAQRSSIWPIIAYYGGSRFGDTAIVSSFNLKTGEGAIGKVFIPGILTALVADSTSPMPKLSFAPFPVQKKPTSFLVKVGLVASGWLGCEVANIIK